MIILKPFFFNGIYPLLLYPHWDDNQPDIEKLTFRRSIFHHFNDAGKIGFHVNKYKEAESFADGVTLEVYADGKLIASKLENPYTNQEYPYSDDGMYHSVIFDFDIPENTHNLNIITRPNGNTGRDHVYIEYFTGIKSNTAIKVLFFLMALIFFSSFCIEWIPNIQNSLTLLFNSKKYPFLFSSMYALFLTLLFYPGILYSDSVARLDIVNHILQYKNLIGVSSHHPIIPILLTLPFVAMIGTVALFTFFQAFLFSFMFFKFVGYFKLNKTTNFVVSLMLLLPINMAYSIFYSNDSLFAVILLCLINLFLYKKHLWLIPVLIVGLVGSRLNAYLTVPFFIYAIWKIKRNFINRWMLCVIVSILGCVFVMLIPKFSGMSKNVSWLIGPAWDYVKMSPKIKDDIDKEYFTSLGLNIDDFDNISYHGMWDGKINVFVSKLNSNNSMDLINHYINFAARHPMIAIKEKIKLTFDLFGISNIVTEMELSGKVMIPEWQEQMKRHGYYPNDFKNTFIKRYNSFIFGRIGIIFNRPWIIILFLFLLSLFLKKREKLIPLLTLFPFSYYCTYIINSQNHEMRYFFPVIYIFMTYLAAWITILIGGDK